MLLLLPVAVLLAGGGVVRGEFGLDGFDPNANGTIHVVVLEPNGNILIGGSFTKLKPNGGAEVIRNRIARLNPNGEVDQQFNPNAKDSVYSIAVQADGKILAGGEFYGGNSIGGQPRNYIARLDPTTGLADSFNPKANDPVLAMAVQADNKILVGGAFSSIGGKTRHSIARLDGTTGAADSFNPDTKSEPVISIVVQDGKILMGGSFITIGGKARNRIARLEATGAVDSFNPNANLQVNAIAVQDVKILVGGSFTSIGGQTRNRFARLDATTGAVDSFNPNVNGNVSSIIVRDGGILVGGSFTSIGGETHNRIARMDLEGVLDPTFRSHANNTVNSIALQTDGGILVGGRFTTIDGQTRNRIGRLYPNLGGTSQSISPSSSASLAAIPTPFSRMAGFGAP